MYIYVQGKANLGWF